MPRSCCLILASLILALVLDPGAVAQGAIPDPRFGVVEAYANQQAAGELGAGWTRITFEWNRIQPNSPDEWNVVPISDDMLAGELAAGRQVVGLLVTAPGWATDISLGPGVPKGLYLSPDDPGNLWATFVRSIVSRYAGRIDHWIIWNEPEIPPTSPDLSWGGSLQDFIQLLRVAYTVIKQTNPNAVVHLASITHWHNPDWFGQFLDALVADPDAAANNYYFDAATLNLYLEPEKIYDIIVHYGGMMRGKGLRKPIWITETNAYLSRVSEEEQAYFIFQAFSLEIAAGAERIEVYKMADTATDLAADPEPFGLVRADGSRRAAFTAYRMAATYLAGFRGGVWERRDTIAQVTVDRGSQTTTVVWARTAEPQRAMVSARTTQALLVDTRGGARFVYPERGYYFLDLPGANCAQGCILGGEPFMLVEDAPANAPRAAQPETPTPTPTPADTLTPTPTATPTPSPTPTITPTPTPTDTPTPTPTGTPTIQPTDQLADRPTSAPTPAPLAASDISPARPWLVVGALVLVMGGGLIATEYRKSP